MNSRKNEIHRLWRAKNPEKEKSYRLKAREKMKIYLSKYYEENKERLLEKSREYYWKNRMRAIQVKRIYALKNKDKKIIQNAKWIKNNRGKVCSYYAKRRAVKRYCSPAWRNDFFIEEIYDLAKRRTKALGIKFHVDHIVPLQSKIVCGLHVENNLQIISSFENQKKLNRYWPDMPDAICPR